MPQRYASRIAAALALALTSCNVGAARSPADVLAVPAREARHAINTSEDDWITPGHDYMRTGYQAQSTGLARSTAAGLRLRWKASTGERMYTGPLVYGGNVVITSLARGNDATVYDFEAIHGRLLWKYRVRGEVRATPSIDPARNIVFVTTRNYEAASSGPGYTIVRAGDLYAIDLLSGRPLWTRQLPDASSGAAAGTTHGGMVIANGALYIGTGGGDPPQCSNGGVFAYDESTGRRLWAWHVDPKKRAGGSAWGAIAFDGAHLLLGTGNTCRTPVMTANGAVALDLNGRLVWSFVAHRDSTVDDDTGGGVTLSSGLATFINKNGTFYALRSGSGSLEWSRALGAADGNGGFATASTDGATFVVGAGTLGEGAHRHSALVALDATGSERWRIPMNAAAIGQVAMTNGLVFAGIDRRFVALDSATGRRLWQFASDTVFGPSPAVVASDVYVADDGGNVYAFDMTGMAR